MDMLSGEEIARADLTDWRKPAQGLHARYLVDDSRAPSLTVIADQDGNTGVLCVDVSAGTRD